MRTDLIFYIASALCFIGFVIVLIYYLFKIKGGNNSKPTKSWTIESARKFLEANNYNINEKAIENMENPKEEIKPVETTNNPAVIKPTKTIKKTTTNKTNEKNKSTTKVENKPKTTIVKSTTKKNTTTKSKVEK